KRRAEKGKNEAGMIAFDEGLQVLTDALASGLGSGLQLGQGIASVRRTPAGWEIRPEGGNVIQGFDALLSAGSAHGPSRLVIGDTTDPGLSILSEIHSPPVTSLVLGFRRELVGHPFDGFGVLIPEVEPF